MSNLARDSSSDESGSDGKEEKIDAKRDVKKDERKQVPRSLDYLFFTQDRRDYLLAVRGTGSPSTEKRGRRRISELAKAASNNQSIKTIFAIQQLCTSQKTIPTIESTGSQSLKEKENKDVSEIKETIEDRAVYDLSELMRLKTEQHKKYEAMMMKTW